MSFFSIWQQAFGISYSDSLVATVALGVLLGVYSAAFDINMLAWLKRARRPDDEA